MKSITHHDTSSVGFVSPGAGQDVGTECLGLVALVAVQDGHEVADVARGQPQGLDLGELGVGRHVGYAVPQVGEGVVYALGASPLLLIRGVPALDRLDHEPVMVVHSRRVFGFQMFEARRELLGWRGLGRLLLVHEVAVVLLGLLGVLLRVILDADLLDQGRGRGGGTARSGTASGYARVGAPVSRLAVPGVGNT